MGPLSRLAWWWLRRRGYAVQMNTPELCEGGGWHPLFSIRYGRVPVYRVSSQRSEDWNVKPGTVAEFLHRRASSAARGGP